MVRRRLSIVSAAAVAALVLAPATTRGPAQASSLPELSPAPTSSRFT